MKKSRNIFYWIATAWLALGMSSTAIVQILQLEEEVKHTSLHLDYPLYLLHFIGLCKLAGVITILVPKFVLLKEWAYAGFTFLMVGALISHAALRDEASAFFGPSLLLLLTFASWYLRPESRRINLNFSNSNQA